MFLYVIETIFRLDTTPSQLCTDFTCDRRINLRRKKTDLCRTTHGAYRAVRINSRYLCKLNPSEQDTIHAAAEQRNAKGIHRTDK